MKMKDFRDRKDRKGLRTQRRARKKEVINSRTCEWITKTMSSYVVAEVPRV